MIPPEIGRALETVRAGENYISDIRLLLLN